MTHTFVVDDPAINAQLDELMKILKDDFNIKSCSKCDVIRYLLDIKRQGKKTSINWKKLFQEEEK